MKTILKFSLIVLSIAIGTSCSTEDDYKVIEGLKIGVNESIYRKQLDSLNIEKNTFFTQFYLTNPDEFRNIKRDLIYTNTFSLLNNNTTNIKYIGALEPKIDLNSKKVIGLYVLLGHTSDLMGYSSKEGFLSVTKQLNTHSSFNQSINKSVFDSIHSMLKTKYGNPKKIDNYKNLQLPVF